MYSQSVLIYRISLFPVLTTEIISCQRTFYGEGQQLRAKPKSKGRPLSPTSLRLMGLVRDWDGEDKKRLQKLGMNNCRDISVLKTEGTCEDRETTGKTL